MTLSDMPLGWGMLKHTISASLNAKDIKTKLTRRSGTPVLPSRTGVLAAQTAASGEPVAASFSLLRE